MIFAAGRGTRMAPLTDARPKPLIDVAGRPLIDYAIDLARDAGVSTIVANTHYLPDALDAHLRQSQVTVVHEQTLLETGGGLQNALPMLGDGPVITLNSDVIWSGSNPITHLISEWRPKVMDALLVLVPKSSALAHAGNGDFEIDNEGRLRRGRANIFSGLQIINTDRLLQISEQVFSLNRVWDMIAAEGRLFGTVHDGGWCDVGRPESIALAERMLRV